MSDLSTIGVTADLEAEIKQAWHVTIPADLTFEEFWQRWIERDERLVELYTRLVDLVPSGVVHVLVLDARTGREASIREAQRELRSLEQRRAKPHGETAVQP